MIVCPLCEHQQAAGSECEQCGRPLAEGRGTDAPVTPLDGLEPTMLEAGPATADGAEVRLDDLEATSFEPTGAPLRDEVVQDLEPTRSEAVDVLVEETPGLERTQAAIPDDEPTPLLAAVICRYCHAQTLPGEVFCDRCGMQLPRAPARIAAAPTEQRLCGCGAPVTRTRCPACGARNAVP